MPDWLTWLTQMLGAGDFTPYNAANPQIDLNQLPAGITPDMIAAVGPRQSIWARLFGLGPSLSTTATPGTTANPTSGTQSSWLALLLQLIQAGVGAKYGGSELDAIRDIYNRQRAAAAQAMNLQPGALAAQAAAMARPLNRRLAYQVTSAADQNSALRGMMQAPGAVAAGEAAALAPFEQQNLQMGADLALNANQLALQRLNPTFQIGQPDYMAILNQIGNFATGQYTDASLEDFFRQLKGGNPYALPTGTGSAP